MADPAGVIALVPASDVRDLFEGQILRCVFFQAEDGIRDVAVTGVQTCALPICYCNEACSERARQWRAWKARRRYRQSANGKQKRQAQSRRYRERWPGRARTKKLSPWAPRGSSLPNFFCAQIGRASCRERV